MRILVFSFASGVQMTILPSANPLYNNENEMKNAKLLPFLLVHISCRGEKEIPS
jgi:hypothetical protein